MNKKNLLKKVALLIVLILQSNNAIADSGFNLLEKGIEHYDKKEYNEAEYYFKNACDKKNALACNKLGWLYYRGKDLGFNNDYLKSRNSFEKSCKYGYAKSCSMGAKLYMFGDYNGLKVDFDKAYILAKKGCENNMRSSCDKMSLLTFVGAGIEQDIKKVINIKEKICDLNNIYCAYLGNIYSSGELVTEKAIKSFKKSCEKGSAFYCLAYKNVSESVNKYITKDISKSVYYYDLSCKDRSNRSCKKLGDLYWHGTEISKDIEKADYYYKKCKSMGLSRIGYCEEDKFSSNI